MAGNSKDFDSPVSLPDSWASVSLGEVCEILDAKRIPVNANDRAVRVEGKARNTLYPYYGATGQVGVIDDYIFEGEHVLLGEDGAPFLDPLKNKAYLVSDKFWVNNHAHILRAFVSNKYLCYCLNQIDYAPYVTGTTRLKLNQKAMRSISLPFAPENEQHRIVTKLEQLFSELDDGVKSLKKTQAQLPIQRESLLNNAFEGKLTKHWRAKAKVSIESAVQILDRVKAERATRYEERIAAWKAELESWIAAGNRGDRPKKPRKLKELPELTSKEIAELPKLPEGWRWAKVDSIHNHEQNAIKAGPFGSALKKSSYVPKGYKVYGQEQVISGDWRLGDYFVGDEKYKQLENCKVSPNDVLISLVGTVGKVLVLPEDVEPGIINPRLIKISPNLTAYNPKFFKYYFESRFLKDIYSLKTHGATMDVLNLGIIQELPFPICSLEEQAEIVRQLDDQFDSLDRLALDIDAGLSKAEVMKQCVLRAAFCGKLVPQDQNDEPASELLKQIEAERATTQKKPRKGRPSRVKKAEKEVVMANLMEVLIHTGDWISATDAFRQCGIADGSQTDEIEQLFQELRTYVLAGAVEVERRGDEDWLRVA